MYIKIAIRNLLRNEKRLILNLLLIAASSFFFIYAASKIDGILSAIEQSGIDTLTGHITISPNASARSYFNAATSRKMSIISGADIASIKKMLAESVFIEAFSERIRFFSLLGGEEISIPILFAGVEAHQEKNVCPDIKLQLANYMKAPDNILLSKKAASSLALSFADPIVLFAETPDAGFNAAEFRLGGYLAPRVMMDEFIEKIAIVDINAVRKLLYIDGGASEIAIRLKTREVKHLSKYIGLIRQKIEAENISGLDVRGYQKSLPELDNMKILVKAMGTVQVFIIFLIMIIIILISLSFELNERLYEIGAMSSIGFTPPMLVKIFLLEVFIKITAGFLAGCLIAILYITIVRANGGIVAPNQFAQYGSGGKIMMPVLVFFKFLLTYLTVIFISLIVLYFPCRNIARKNVIDLLRTQK
ncbi:MAG TPA: hypothetical protein DC049_06570 [Spirochaetia bacterium]|nr:hypothetical protein [Spirochaetia bacterium]